MRSSVSSAPDGSVEHATASDSIDGGASFQFVDAPPPPIVTQISQATQPNPYTQSQQIDTQLLPPPLNTPRAAVSHFNTSIPHSSHTASTVNTDLNAILPVRHSRRIAHATAERDARLQSIRRIINDDKQRRSSLGSDVGHNVSAQSTPPSATDGDGNCDPTFEELNEKYIPPLVKEYPTPDFMRIHLFYFRHYPHLHMLHPMSTPILMQYFRPVKIAALLTLPPNIMITYNRLDEQ